MSLEVTVRYFDGCPHWKQADHLLREVLDELDIAATVSYENINTPELAEEHSFRGSPTILINGEDPFLDTESPVGLSCRLYPTPDGRKGTPTREQVIDALRPAMG